MNVTQMKRCTVKLDRMKHDTRKIIRIKAKKHIDFKETSQKKRHALYGNVLMQNDDYIGKKDDE